MSGEKTSQTPREITGYIIVTRGAVKRLRYDLEKEVYPEDTAEALVRRALEYMAKKWQRAGELWWVYPYQAVITPGEKWRLIRREDYVELEDGSRAPQVVRLESPLVTGKVMIEIEHHGPKALEMAMLSGATGNVEFILELGTDGEFLITLLASDEW